MSSTSLTAELFIIPTDGAYIVYAPLRQAAFVANAAMVNLLAAVQSGAEIPLDDDCQNLVALLRHLLIIDGGPEVPPVTAHHGTPKPTTRLRQSWYF